MELSNTLVGGVIIRGPVAGQMPSQALLRMDTSSVDDTALIAQIARGDRRAFEAFYDRYAGQVLGLAMRMLQDRTAAEDVAQEAFCRVWQRAKDFSALNGSGNLRAWLLTIVHRLAIDAQRRSRPHVEIDAHDDGEWDVEDHDADVFEHAFSQLSGKHVRTAVAQLSDKHRQVIELAFFRGKTHREIADELGQPVGTVSSWAAQGMTALKALLKQHVR